MSRHLFLGMVESLATVILFVIVFYAHLRHRLKDTIMAAAPVNPRDETDVIAKPTPQRKWSPDTVPMEAQSSVNDVQAAREQDLALATLAAQYEDMTRSPWERTDYAFIEGGGATTMLKVLTRCLSTQMVPPAAVGQNRATGQKGYVSYVDVGPNKVWASEELSHAILKALLANYYRQTAPIRSQMLDRICSVVQAAEITPAPVSGNAPVIRCGQTIVFIEDAQERDRLHASLNAAYFTIIQPAIDALRADILQCAQH